MGFSGHMRWFHIKPRALQKNPAQSHQEFFSTKPKSSFGPSIFSWPETLPWGFNEGAGLGIPCVGRSVKGAVRGSHVGFLFDAFELVRGRYALPRRPDPDTARILERSFSILRRLTGAQEAVPEWITITIPSNPPLVVPKQLSNRYHSAGVPFPTPLQAPAA